jgi:hypothetical protein
MAGGEISKALPYLPAEQGGVTISISITRRFVKFGFELGPSTSRAEG